MAVDVGTPAPDFELESDAGERVRLSSLRGSPVVLYFYPKDDTPGCTIEACDIRDTWAESRRRVRRVRRQPGSARPTRRSREVRPAVPAAGRHRPAMAEKYGVWQEKTYQGKTYMGIDRSTFVIDADGNVAKVMRGVKADEHADDVLAARA